MTSTTPDIQRLAAIEETSPPPQWFHNSLLDIPERRTITVEGANIELLTWGEVGKPGIMLAHGNSGHADWWSFIAPLLATQYRVAALSFSGAGNSDWRENYRFDQHAAELDACAQLAGLYHAMEKPVYVGHSYGAAQIFYCAAHYPDRMKAAILIDAEFGNPPVPGDASTVHKIFRRTDADGQPAPFRVYASFAEALLRFRFTPPQTPRLPCAADYIARTSLKRAPLLDGSGDGWTWKFDPGRWDKLDHEALRTIDPGDAPPISLIWGETSHLRRRYDAGGLRDFLLPELPSIVIPDAAHHVMIDQPIALTTALLAFLAVWPSGEKPEGDRHG